MAKKPSNLTIPTFTTFMPPNMFATLVVIACLFDSSLALPQQKETRLNEAARKLYRGVKVPIHLRSDEPLIGEPHHNNGVKGDTFAGPAWRRIELKVSKNTGASPSSSSAKPTSTSHSTTATPAAHPAPAPGVCDALAKVLAQIGGPVGKDNCCTWTGVTCKGTLITTLELPSAGLKGSLPQALFALQDLTKLYVSIILRCLSVLPNSCLDLPFIFRNLTSNDLSGSLPDLFAALPKLKTLDLSSNSLSGPIPGSITHHQALSSIHLSNNELAGPASFSAPQLSNIVIDNNQLTGPLELTGSMVDILQRVMANDNHIGGELPDLHTATQLMIFNVARNSM